MSDFNEINRLHQVIIIDGMQHPAAMPSKLEENTLCARQLYPRAKYKLWCGEELRDLIRHNFDANVLGAFDTLKPYSYKCDLARFCLLYVYGGLYVDLAVRLLNLWTIPKSCGVAAFTEMYPGMRSWTATQTSLLWSRPGRTEWAMAIAQIVENCRLRYYGPHDHYPTAGAVLGRAFAAAMASKGQTNESDDQWVGEVRYVTPEASYQNVTYVSPDRLLVGLRTKNNTGDLSQFKLLGINNYVKIWKQRKVYGELDYHWSYEDDSLLAVTGRSTKSLRGIEIKYGTKGMVVAGPYVTLSSGTYTLKIKFSPETSIKRLHADLASEYGSEVIKKFSFLKSDLKENEITARFDLQRTHEGVEFRLYTLGDFEGCVISYAMTKDKKRVWHFTNETIRTLIGTRSDDGIRVAKGANGRALHGPYTEIDKGDYNFKMLLTPETTFGRLRVAITSDCAERTHHVFDYTGDLRVGYAVDFDFCLCNDISDAEFLVDVFGDFDGAFRSFELERR